MRSPLHRISSSLLLFALSFSLFANVNLAQAAIYSATRTAGGGSVTMTPGQTKTVSVTFQNTSDFTWKNDGPGFVSLYTHSPKYRASVFDPGTWLSPSQVKRIPDVSVKKGGTTTINFQLRAPSIVGNYTEGFSLASESYAWFDGGNFTLNITVKAAASPTISSTKSSTTSSGVVSTNPHQGASAELAIVSANKIKLIAGKSAFLTAGFKNTGTTTWKTYGLKSPDINIASLSAVSLKHASWKGNILADAIGSIKPGQTAYVSFALTAPKTNGKYTTNFQFTANGSPIDDALINIPVEVTGGAEAAITAPISNNVDNPSTLITEPTMRVGALIVDEETQSQVIITSSQSDFDVRDGNGNLLAEMKQGQSVTAAWTGIGYTFNRGKGIEKSSSYLRFIPKTLNAIMTVSNFDRKVTRHSSFTDNQFRNILELRHNDDKDRTWLINELSMEYYLRGLAETSNLSHAEFQKALITAARTYAFYHWSRATKHASEFFHVDAWLDQVYKGYGQEARTPNLTIAIAATRGLIVTYQGGTAITSYFSRSDGRTRDWSDVWFGNVAWAKSVPVPCDVGKTLWGHGVGMSASGALCMANDGQLFDSILKHFYTGIDITKKWE